LEDQSKKFCSNCGAQIDPKAEICPKCGVRVASPIFTEKNNPAIAAVLSFFIIGLGQLYLGRSKRGAVMFIAGIVLAITSFLVLPGIALVILWLLGIIDAYKLGNGEPGTLDFVGKYISGF